MLLTSLYAFYQNWLSGTVKSPLFNYYIAGVEGAELHWLGTCSWFSNAS